MITVAWAFKSFLNRGLARHYSMCLDYRNLIYFSHTRLHLNYIFNTLILWLINIPNLICTFSYKDQWLLFETRSSYSLQANDPRLFLFGSKYVNNFCEIIQESGFGKSFLRLKIVDECKMKAVFSYKFLSSLQVYRIDLTSRSLTSDTVSKISYPTLNSRVV